MELVAVIPCPLATPGSKANELHSVNSSGGKAVGVMVGGSVFSGVGVMDGVNVAVNVGGNVARTSAEMVAASNVAVGGIDVAVNVLVTVAVGGADVAVQALNTKMRMLVSIKER